MSIVQIIIIVGAACVSPIEPAPTTTTAYKVPCAIIVSDGGSTDIVKDQARVEPPKAKPAPVVKKTKPCKRRYYWKKKKRYWKCR